MNGIGVDDLVTRIDEAVAIYVSTWGEVPGPDNCNGGRCILDVHIFGGVRDDTVRRAGRRGACDRNGIAHVGERWQRQCCGQQRSKTCASGKKFKAVQTGGPSGGCLTEKHLDLPIDFDSLSAAGSMMGSGGMIVMDEDDCMVSMARFYLEFTVEESCGKCAPCRIGNKRLYEMLTKLCDDKGSPEDLDLLRNLSVVVKDTSLCGLGQTSPNPILSTMENFFEEYHAHAVDHKCPSGQCKSFLRYYISEENCIGCVVCARNCPVNAISGEKKKVHVINQDTCIKCGVCMEKCKFDAISLN